MDFAFWLLWSLRGQRLPRKQDIIRLWIGDSQAVLCTVLFPGEHIDELKLIAHQVAQLANFR